MTERQASLGLNAITANTLWTNEHGRMNSAPFPLTLTLSPGKRGQPCPRFGLRGAFVLPHRSASAQRSVRSALSPRERAGVRGNGAPENHPASLFPERLLLPRSLFRFRRRSAVVRQRMRRALLQRSPYRVADAVLVPPQIAVPEAQHLHARFLQPRVTLRIPLPLLREAMLASIQLDVHERLHAEEIQHVLAEPMLPAKLVAGESPVPQPSPQQFLRPRVFLAEQPGDVVAVGHRGSLAVTAGFLKPVGVAMRPSPSPQPSPPGRGSHALRPSPIRGFFPLSCRTNNTCAGPEPDASELPTITATPSLSPGERAGARGNGALELQPAFQLQ